VAKSSSQKGKLDSAAAKHLQTEVKRAIDRAVKGFSLMRAAGKKDERDDGLQASDDSDGDSIEFMGTVETEKVLGPHIPTEHRLIVAQALQKMGSLWNEKKQQKGSIIQDWRLKTASIKTGALKKYNQAFFNLHTIFQRRRNNFFKIAVVSSANRNHLEVNPYLDSARPSTIPSRATKINESFVIDRQIITDPTIKSNPETAKLLKEIESLKELVNKKDDYIRSLEEERAELIMNRDHSLGNILDSPTDKPLTNLNTKTFNKLNQGNSELKRRETDIVLPSPMSYQNGRNPLQGELEEMIKKVRQLEEELKKSKLELQRFSPLDAKKTDLSTASTKMQSDVVLQRKGTSDLSSNVNLGISSFKRIRVLVTTISRLERNQKLKSFVTLIKSTIKKSKSMGEAGLRIKGRLLQFMSEKHSTAGVRRSFLRWAVLVNRNFLRDCITKVALNSRITHQSALWRFLKMVPRNVKVKLSEAAKRIRYLKAMSMVEYMIKINNVISLIHSMNQIRPGVIGYKNRKLIDLLIKRSQLDEASKLKALNSIVQKNRNKKDFCKDLLTAFLNKHADALSLLRRHNEIAKLQETLYMTDPDFITSADMLSRAAKRNISDALSVGRHNHINDLLKSLINKVDAGNRRLLEGALGNLGDNLEDWRRLTAENSWKNKLRDAALRKMLEKMVEASKGKIGQALNKLAGKVIAEKFEAERQRLEELAAKTKRDKLLKGVLGKGEEAWRGKEKTAFDKLLAFIASIRALEKFGELQKDFDAFKQAAADRLKRKTLAELLRRFINGYNGAKRNALNTLRNFLRDSDNDDKLRKQAGEKDALLKKKLLANMLAKLVHGADMLSGTAFGKLLGNKNLLALMEEIERARAQSEKAANLKKLKNLHDRLKLAQEGKAKQAFFNLQQNNSELTHRKTISGLNKTTADSISRLILNTAFDRLVKAQKAKQKLVLRKLGDQNKEGEKKEKEKRDALKKLTGKLGNSGQVKLGKALGKLRLINALLEGEEKFARANRDRNNLLKNVTIKSLLDDLITAQMLKEKQSFNNLGFHCGLKIEADTLTRTKEEAAKRLSKEILSKLLDKIKRAYDAKGKEILGALLENSKKVEFQDQLKNARAGVIHAQLKNLLRLLDEKIKKGNDDLLKDAFDRIKNMALARQLLLANLSMEDERHRLFRRGKLIESLERLKAACLAKERESMSLLKFLNDQAKTSSEWANALNEYKNKLRNKSLAYVLSKACGAQAGTLKNALKFFVENAKEAARKEKLLNDRLFKAQNSKLKEAYGKLCNLAELLKAQEALERARKEAQMTLEESEIKNNKRKAVDFLKRLKIAQEAKLTDTLRHMRGNKIGLAHDEETKKMIDDASAKIWARKIQAFLTKLKLAQMAKETEAFTTLGEACKALEAAKALEDARMESERALRAKTLKALGNILTGSSLGKLGEGLRLLKGHSQKLKDMQAADIGKLKNIMARLLKAHGLKIEDAFSKLLGNNLMGKSEEAQDMLRKLKEEELKKAALRTLLEGLGGGLLGKLGLANGLLKSHNWLSKTEEQGQKMMNILKNQKLLNMLNRLIKAQLAKEQACLLRGSKNSTDMAKIESENDFKNQLLSQKERAAKLAAMKQLMGGNTGKLLAALGLLKDNMALQNLLLSESERAAYLNGLRKNSLLKGLINAQLDKEGACFNQMKRYSDLIGAKNTDARKAQVIATLLRNYQQKLQNALRKLIMNGLTAAADKERERAKLLSMLKHLLGGQEDKERGALGKLRDWATSDAHAEYMNQANLRNNLNKLLLLAGKNGDKNREFCYLKMAQFAKDLQRKENLKKMLLAALLRGLLGKLKGSGNLLRQNALHETNKSRLNETLMEIEQDRVMLLKKGLLERLILAQQAKQRKALEELGTHSDLADQKQKSKEKTANLMAGMLRRNWGDARLDAYRLMAKFAQINKLQLEKDRVLLEDLLRRLGGSSVGKLLGAFGRLKDKNAKDKLKDLERNKLLADLLKGLEGSYGQKLRDTFGKMKDHYLIMDSKLTKEGYKKAQIGRSLGDSFKDKLAEAFKKLRDHNRHENDMMKRDLELLKLLGKKLGGANGSKVLDALYLLRNHCKDAELEDTKNKLKRRKLLERLIPAQINKLDQALKRLKDANSRAIQDEKMRKSATGVLLFKLLAAQNAKQLEAIRNLDKFKDDLLRRAMQAKDKLNFLIKKVNAGYTGKLYDSMNMLRKKNSTEKRLLEEFQAKMVFLLNRLAAAHYLKTVESFHKLHKLISGGKTNEQMKAEAAALLARRLLNGLLSKQRQSLNGLGKNNAESLFLDMLRKNGQGNSFSKLFGSSNGKLKGGLDLLRAFNNKMKQQEAEVKENLSKLLKRLELAHAFKTLEALKKLREHTKDSQSEEAKAFRALKFLLNRLNGSSGAKAGGAFKDLLSFARLNKEDDPETLKALACKRLLGPLLKACRGKTFEVVDKLAGNSTHRKSLLERLLQGLAGKGDRVAMQALNRLRHHSSQGALQDAFKQQLLGKLAAAKKKAADQELRDLFAKMKAWRNNKLAEEKSGARVAHKLGVGWHNAQVEAYRLLKQKAEAAKRREARAGELRQAMLRGLVRAQEEKSRQAFTKMTDWKNKGDVSKQRDAFLIKLLLSMLSGSQGLALKTCIGLLRKFNSDGKLREAEEAAKRKELIRRLIGAQDDKRDQGYKTMFGNAESALVLFRKKMALMKSILGKLENACRAKQGQGIKKLRDLRALFEKYLNRLRAVGEAAGARRLKSLANGLKKLRGWNDEDQRREEALRIKAGRVKERITQWLREKMEDERRRALEKLIKNAYEQRIKEERIKKLLNDIAFRKEMQVQRVVSIMRLNNVIKSVKEGEKNNKFGKLLLKMYNRLLQEGYNRLHKRTVLEPKIINSLLAKAEDRRNNKLLKHFFDQMVEILKSKPQRIERFGDFLTSKIRLRQQQGFSEIKLFLELSRRERINKGLVRLIEMFYKAGLGRCRGSFEEVKRQYHNDNPWFRKAVDKMTISVTCSEQVAFWKLRKQEKFGGSAIVNAEKTIKLKKFLQIFDKKSTKLMNSALERILARKTYGLGDSTLNTSYLSSNRNSMYRK
jgi:hypothetical protein